MHAPETAADLAAASASVPPTLAVVGPPHPAVCHLFDHLRTLAEAASPGGVACRLVTDEDGNIDRASHVLHLRPDAAGTAALAATTCGTVPPGYALAARLDAAWAHLPSLPLEAALLDEALAPAVLARLLGLALDAPALALARTGFARLRDDAARYTDPVGFLDAVEAPGAARPPFRYQERPAPPGEELLHWGFRWEDMGEAPVPLPRLIPELIRARPMSAMLVVAADAARALAGIAAELPPGCPVVGLSIDAPAGTERATGHRAHPWLHAAYADWQHGFAAETRFDLAYLNDVAAIGDLTGLVNAVLPHLSPDGRIVGLEPSRDALHRVLGNVRQVARQRELTVMVEEHAWVLLPQMSGRW